MEAMTYRLDQFEGPLDLLLTLIHKNKVNISDIPIALICDQYLATIAEAQALDMEVASEFLVMASELMLIKSRMLLPRNEEEADDPRATLTDALLRYQQAKEAVAKLSPLYAYYHGRMVKDTDEISVDKTFVADQSVTSLCLAVRRIISYREEHPRADKVTFTPMIAKPIVPVEAKIVGILRHFEAKERVSMVDLIEDAVSLPDMIAVFLGILELVKLRRIVLVESDETVGSVYGIDTQFVAGEDPASEDTSSEFSSDFDSQPNQTHKEVNDHAE